MSIDRLLAGRMTVPDDLEATRRLSKIFIRDLVLLCSIGVYPQERLAPQRVRINVAIRVREPEGALNDDIGKVLSYDSVITDIKALVGRGHINLVETLAEEIANLCFADPRVEEVRVMVEKLDAQPEAASVGVEIERRRKRPSPASIYPLPFVGGPSVRRRDGGD